MKKIFLLLLSSVMFLISACAITNNPSGHNDYELIFPSDKYPETALHISGAIAQGHSNICTIDRIGAEENRKESLTGMDTRNGYDRDEWPMAMCKEGGKGASVAYIDPSDNRGAGSWVGNQLADYPDGTKVAFIVNKPENIFPTSHSVDKKTGYKNCAEAREAGAAPIRKGDPGYSAKLDRDGDGIACET